MLGGLWWGPPPSPEAREAGTALPGLPAVAGIEAAGPPMSARARRVGQRSPSVQAAHVANFASCRCSRSPTPASTCARGSSWTPVGPADLGCRRRPGRRQVPRHRPPPRRASGRRWSTPNGCQPRPGPRRSGAVRDRFDRVPADCRTRVHDPGSKPGRCRRPACGDESRLCSVGLLRATGTGR